MARVYEWRQSPLGLERHSITVHGVERSYWMLPPPVQAAPLLLVLHGMGLNGPRMAAWTGLAERGTEAGFATVFPDAVNEIWDDAGLGWSDGIDDTAFIAALVDRLVSDAVGHERVLFLAGLSNGAFFAERLVRHGLIRPTGIVLVAGTAREASRRVVPHPEQGTAVLMFEGTRDRLVPFAGGRGTGPLAWMARRRTRRLLLDSGRRGSRGRDRRGRLGRRQRCSSAPKVEPLSVVAGDLVVNRLSWTMPRCPPVVLYRIAGGGHGWPGGPQYMPAVLVGPIARHLDATGILLDFALGEIGAAPRIST